MKSPTLALFLACACATTPAPVAAPEPAAAPVKPAPPPAPKFDALSRLAFNAAAAEKFVPLFWRTDANGNGALDPDELVQLWGFPGPELSSLVRGGAFTPAFAALYAALQAPEAAGALPPEEQKRRAAVRDELAQGRPTLVETVIPNATAEDTAILASVARAATLIERLHARQNGVFGLDAKIPDAASKALFFRNQGPFCSAPRTEKNPDCSALPERPKHLSGLYPVALQEKSPKFCEQLAKAKNAKALMDHFSVVVEGKQPGTFEAVPYPTAYAEDMEAIAKELDGAAAAITSADEAAFKAYLTQAAKSFRTNDWEPANGAWAAMGVENSKWYLRIAPDEVYYEPCAFKAGFHVSFARINKDSVAWQKRLEPVKGQMEAALAALAGPPYKARQVKFKLPDFIDIVLNAGDARDSLGATIGQSLPNWGKVAEAGGRTVAMTNLYGDPDSKKALEEQMAALFCPATNARASADPEPALMSTVLHEAAHNLGPAHDYKVGGKGDAEVFGGTLASTLEELKAQTSALYFAQWLVEKGVVSKELAERAHVRDTAWAFGHIAQGMYTGDDKPKAYSQLAAIQLGTLNKASVLTWSADALAANGKDKGCFELDLARWPAAVDALAKRVLQIKGKGNKADAEALKAEFVDGKNPWASLRGTIAERWLRAPKANFVYSFPR